MNTNYCLRLDGPFIMMNVSIIHLMSYYLYHYWQLSNVFLLWVQVSELEMLPKAVTTIIFWVDLLLSNALSLNSVKPISILGISCCCQSCSTLDSVRSWVFFNSLSHEIQNSESFGLFGQKRLTIILFVERHNFSFSFLL